MKITYCDSLIIGGGLAGLRVAIDCADNGLDAIVLSLVPAKRSHSSAAQGGMQASLSNSVKGEGDNEDVHFEDTVKGSDWGCDQEVARMFVQTAPKAIRELAGWGVPWSRISSGKKEVMINEKKVILEEGEEKEGLINARDFGGTKKWRTCYSSDATGHVMLYSVANEAIKRNVVVKDRKEAISLIYDNDICYGAIVMDLITGEIEAYVAKGTLIATGGYGRLYRQTTNAIICKGIGQAIALETGIAKLGNMEAVQFHPTPIVPSGILLTEGCRGDGGVLRDKDGYRFMPDYEPEKKDLASRDVVSRRMMEHIRAGKGVDSPYGKHLWLDISILGREHIEKNLRDIQDICKSFNDIDPADEGVYAPVRPMQHYSMGGIRTDKKGHTALKGLFSCGESACWDLHGFNRLGGNSVAETVVSGMIVGDYFSKYCQDNNINISTKMIEKELNKQNDYINSLLENKGDEDIYKIEEEMKDIMDDNVGIFRNEKNLQEAVDRLEGLLKKTRNVSIKHKYKNSNPELELAYRTPKMLKLALCVALGALERKESRGAHTREDYPKRDDKNWLKRTLASWENENDTMPTLTYEELDIQKMELPPGFRGYGKKGNIVENEKSQSRLDEVEKIKEEISNKGGDRFDIQDSLMPYELQDRYKKKNERINIGDK